MTVSEAQEFSYREARSGAVTAAITIALIVESLAVHFAVAVRHPLVAWALTLTSVTAILWLVRDYRALGAGRVRLESDRVRLAIGRRYDVALPRIVIARVVKPTFRDLPAPGTTQGRDYVNLTKPAAPNVLVTLTQPVEVRLPGGLRRNVQRIGLRLDDPTSFLRALQPEPAAAGISPND